MCGLGIGDTGAVLREGGKSGRRSGCTQHVILVGLKGTRGQPLRPRPLMKYRLPPPDRDSLLLHQ